MTVEATRPPLGTPAQCRRETLPGPHQVVGGLATHAPSIGQPGAKVINLHRIDPTNIGDLNSAPAQHVAFLRHARRMDICEINQQNFGQLNEAVVILGGGGLIGQSYFEAGIRAVLQARPKRRICWGAGHNDHEHPTIELPVYLDSFDLVGVRDYGKRHEWVPDASCLHPLFDQRFSIKHDVVLYEHPRFGRTALNELPKMDNRERSFSKVLKFLASGETVLTSSYHGAYWGTLLNRKIILINAFSSKFHGFKHQPPIASEGSWKSKLAEARSYPEALAECRGANLRFSEKVMALLT